MNWIFGAFLGASLFHMGEEYFYPGGFMGFMKRLNPKFSAVGNEANGYCHQWLTVTPVLAGYDCR